MPGTKFLSYKSYDSMKNKLEGGTEFTPEYLNWIEFADLTPYDLKLKNKDI